MDASHADISSMAEPQPWSWPDFVTLAAAGLTLTLIRLHAFDLPLETDECNYIYIAGRLLNGDRLYVDVWDHQPFGVFAFFAGLISVFGDAPHVFRWAATSFSLVSLALIHALVRQCSGFWAATMAAAIFAFVSSDPGTAGEGCNREIFMSTFVLGAWWLILRPHPRPHKGLAEAGCGSSGTSLGGVCMAGALLAVGSSFKTILAIHWILLAIGVLWQGSGKKSGGWLKRSSITLGAFAAGPVILWGGALAYFWSTDRLEAFVDAVFRFNLSYSGASEGILERWDRFFSPPRHPYIFESAWPLWLLAIGATAWHAYDAPRHRRFAAVMVLLLLASSFIAVCLPGRFWPHYYYLLIPPCVLAVATAFAGVAATLTRWAARRRLRATWVVAVFYVIVPATVFAWEYEHYLRQPSFGITAKRYNSRDFWGRAQGENVRRVTEPGDEVFVYGNEAEIYYYAKRRCASRYTMITGLQSGYDGFEARRATLMAELEQRMPRVIIVLFDEPPFDEWRRFLEKHYGEAVGWDRHDATGDIIMLVFCRKDQPIQPIDWDWDRAAVGGWFAGPRE